MKNELSKIRADGGTNMSAAIDCCATIFEDASLTADNEYNSRILFLTDAQPNEGNMGEKHFSTRIEQLAKHRIYTIFIGVGIKSTSDIFITTAHLFVTYEDRLGNNWSIFMEQTRFIMPILVFEKLFF